MQVPLTMDGLAPSRMNDQTSLVQVRGAVG